MTKQKKEKEKYPYLIVGVITLILGIAIACFYSITKLKELSEKIFPEVALLLAPIFFGIVLTIFGIFIIYNCYKQTENDKNKKT